MGLAEIQGILARLYVDSKLRDRFFSEPAAVGAELGLDAAEAQQLACLSRPQVEQFAASLRSKRRDQVCRVVPTAARAMGPRFASLFEQYAAGSPPRGSKADLDDAAGFVDALRRLAEPLEPAWAVDLARYELAWRQAARAGWLPIVRAFRYPVTRLVPGAEPITPQTTFAFWWRPMRRGRARHLVVAVPRFLRSDPRQRLNARIGDKSI
jgi:hypothetical protein